MFALWRTNDELLYDRTATRSAIFQHFSSKMEEGHARDLHDNKTPQDPSECKPGSSGQFENRKIIGAKKATKGYKGISFSDD